jgi:hypothetical protein
MAHDYASALRASESVAWRLDTVLPLDARLDFSRPFLPEALVGAEPLTFLDARERRVLNHIRAHGYLCTFGLVEEFILPFVLERLERRAQADHTEVRALLSFASEEAKHIELFRRFRDTFERGFGHHCEVIGPASAIRDHVLGKSELGIGLLILHIEWMTQRHYLEMVRGDDELEPSFRRLLHHHWLEECQHARIDGWIVDAVTDISSSRERTEGFRDYVELLAFLDRGLEGQVALDLDALERVTGRRFSAAECDAITRLQHAALRRTFLGSGVSHQRLRAAVQRIQPTALIELDCLARLYDDTPEQPHKSKQRKAS